MLRRLLVLGGTALALLVVLVALALMQDPRPEDPDVAEEAPEPEAQEPPSPDRPTPPRGQDKPVEEGGLHYTPQEVEVWRTRAREGPYRQAGDAGENSPGDWERVAANAEAFLEDPSEGRWEGPSQDGCVEPDDDDLPPTEEPSQLRDAAFYYLVEQDSRYRDAVKDELIAQATEEGVDFSDTERWCPEALNDLNPSPPTAHWMTKLLFAYDYIGSDEFSDEERALLDEWFYDAARYFQTDIKAALNDNFVEREEGHYELTEARADDPGCDRTAFYGSEPICAIARYYNNRRAAQVRFVGLVGLHQSESSLQVTAERFFKEFLAFSVYPEGYFGEFERWRDDLPDLGWAYANNTVGAAVTIADHFARAGDPSLYEETTTAGLQGTEGGPKGLRWAIHVLGRHVDGTYERYATDDGENVGRSEYLINGIHEDREWYSLHDLAIVPANLYYQDDYIRQMYTRTGENMPPYPEHPAPNGDHEIWTGEGGIYPGVLFMFGQMEGEVEPYPEPGEEGRT